MLTAATSDALRRLPKAELHVHLDGSLRPATMLELAAERDVELPVRDPEALARYMRVTEASRLEDYLARFETTLALLQDVEALERVAYELAMDHAAENVRYVEVRFAPVLSTVAGLTAEQVLDAAFAGLARAEREHGIATAIIVCALRSLPPASSQAMAELAVAYQGRGVCAFDLAGAEDGYPVKDHARAFRTAHEADLPVTIHAGEGFGAPSIRQALEIGGASRIGHGTRLFEDPDLLARVRDERIPIEVCLTSNVQTRVALTYEEHPLRPYFDEGLVACLCTDNRLMSGVTLSSEYERARDELGFSADELVAVARYGFEAAFAPEELRAELIGELEEAVRG